ncbi:MAG: hypothetical protein HYY44_01235 [Deltaproteobacteria bacterium]|nr:hypothetical protein [Deltaproteobacteria bacterium]
MKKFLYFTIILPFIVTGCLSTGGEGDFPSGNATQKEKDVSGKLALALGGNAEGHDLVTVDGGAPKVLEFKTENGDLFKLEVPSGFGSFAEARSARLVPQKAGIGYLTPIVDSREREPVQITIPPQKLIQILFGEAGGQLAREASRGEFDVKSSSVSVTGDALGAVIRNRIRMPVNPGDENNDRYLDAVLRSSLRNDDDLIAYDQSVLTAVDIFNEETEDPTEGAFAFYSPTDEEYLVLRAALETADVTLPDGAGTSDAKFPNLAPVQVLILKEIATATSRTNRPSFVFVRERDSAEPAVTDVP